MPPELNRFQAGSHSRTLSEMESEESERALLEVARRLRKLFESEWPDAGRESSKEESVEITGETPQCGC